jgi:hypothetical protein
VSAIVAGRRVQGTLEEAFFLQIAPAPDFIIILPQTEIQAIEI